MSNFLRKIEYFCSFYISNFEFKGKLLEMMPVLTIMHFLALKWRARFFPFQIRIFKVQTSCSILRWILVMPQCHHGAKPGFAGACALCRLPALWSGVHWCWGSVPASLSACGSMVHFVDLAFPNINKSLLCMSLKDFFKGKCFETVPNFLK